METKKNIIPYLSPEQSSEVDKELMSTYSYSIDQLMEIAGYTVASIISNELISPILKDTPIKLLAIIGPGNNGGDGMVACRYLKELYNKKIEIDIYYPKKNEKNELLKRLLNQNILYNNKIIDQVDNEILNNLDKYDFILDGIFGYSFKGDIRQPFKDIIFGIKGHCNKIISIDIPSGWSVKDGNVNDTFEPKYLISLTLPKECAKKYNGVHFLGGRFVPESLYEKMKINVDIDSIYNGCKMYTKI